MAEGFSLILTALAIGVALVSLFTVMGALFTRPMAAAQRAAETRPGRSFLLGFVNLLFLSILALALNALGDGLGGTIIRLLALPPTLAILIGLAFGLAAMASLIGARLSPERNQPAQLALGASVMVLACYTPFLGWFGLFPYLSLRGLGGFVLGLFTRADKPELPA